jgi:hypothetical protein
LLFVLSHTSTTNVRKWDLGLRIFSPL